jgi:hypothetical protein
MAFDGARGVTVLFGGEDVTQSILGDTWEWAGEVDSAWTNYGSGWPGTQGIPGFTAGGDPVLCNPVTLDLGNSLGANTTGVLFIGLAPTDQPTAFAGHLLVLPLNVFHLSLPAAGLSIAGTVPCDSTVCGLSLYLQALEVDAGASRGLSFTRGLRLVLGS